MERRLQGVLFHDINLRDQCRKSLLRTNAPKHRPAAQSHVWFRRSCRPSSPSPARIAATTASRKARNPASPMMPPTTGRRDLRVHQESVGDSKRSAWPRAHESATVRLQEPCRQLALSLCRQVQQTEHTVWAMKSSHVFAFWKPPGFGI